MINQYEVMNLNNLSNDLKIILEIFHNILHVNLTNKIVDQNILCQDVKILENLELKSFCGKELVKVSK